MKHLVVYLIALFIYFDTIGQCINTYPHIENFDGTISTWTSGGVNNSWQLGSPNKYAIQSTASGTNSWVTGGLTGSFYSLGERSYVESPCYDFSTLTTPMVSMKIYWESERNFDGTTFQYSINNGTTWVTVGTNTDPNDCFTENWFNTASCNNLNTLASPTHCWTGNSLPNSPPCLGGSGSLGWVTAKHCLLMLAGQPNVKFRFAFGVGTNCNNYDGFAFDDFEILEIPTTPSSYNITCGNNNTFTFNNTSTCYTSYSWNFGDTTSGASNTSTNANPTHTFLTGGNYTITLTATGPCGLTSVSTQTLSVSSFAVAGISPKCNGINDGSITTTVQNASGAVTYTINPNVPGTNGVYNNLSAGTYTVTVTDNNGCTNSKTVVLNNPPALNFSNVTVNQPLCQSQINGSIQVIATGGTGAINYLNVNNTSVNNSGLFNNLGDGTYFIVASDVNLCTSSTIVVLAAPNSIIINSVTTTAASCVPGNDGSITINATGGNGTLTYSSGSSFINSNTLTTLSAATYTIVVQDANSCQTSSVVVVSAPNTPIFTNVSTTAQSCDLVIDGSITAITNTPCTFNLQPASINNNTGVFNNLKAQSYTLTATNVSGCSLSTNVTITLQPALSYDLILPTPVPCDINKGAIQVSTANGIGNVTYTLNGGTPTFGNIFLDLAVGTYTVTATDEKNCTATTLVQLKNVTTCCNNIFVANGFSPNGDKTNDLLSIDYLQDIKLQSFEVYNRWGNLIFETTSINQPWNGTYKGTDCEIGTYYYLLKYQCGITNETKKVMGSIELFR